MLHILVFCVFWHSNQAKSKKDGAINNDRAIIVLIMLYILFPELHRICTVSLKCRKLCYHFRLIFFISDTEPLVR